MQEINVEEIMEQIRNDIKEKGYTPDMLSFKDSNASYAVARAFDSEEFRNTVGHIEMTKYVPWKQDITGQGVKGTAKKAIQKLIGPIIAPASDGQNVHNQQVAEAFAQLLGYVAMQGKLIEEQEEKIASIQKRLEELENK